MIMDDKKPNTFVRALIVGLVLSLCCLGFFNFFLREPVFEISPGLIILLALIVVLSLSEIFDNLSFGKIFSLQRKVTEEKIINKELKHENIELRSQLFNIITNIQQSQVNNTYNTPPELWGKVLGVVPATSTPAIDDVESQVSNPTVTQVAPSETGRNSIRQRSEQYRAANTIALKRYLDSLSVPQSEMLLNAEFSASFHKVDPVMDRKIIFDAYYQIESRERFVQAVKSRTTIFQFIDRLYIMLAKIWFYGQAKKVQAELVLLLVEIEDDDLSEKFDVSKRILEFFQPAIANDILRIEKILISTEDIEKEVLKNQ
ncbi:hypothetical protein KUF54_03095 [Comamonas sp. Y33R10-2]|uniref:hypothetical protein n=1 Tax=Comamonas sp. Y33R10-2 TaxID=2853257 RepID=UPI001C5CA8FC|nr:hypothetical protein [Comamonas sp. Y33R10-2]QXZ10259.1 hypothetical protein KUF54_03095 [Comamonas sp. Y33R10-2]